MEQLSTQGKKKRPFMGVNVPKTAKGTFFIIFLVILLLGLAILPHELQAGQDPRIIGGQAASPGSWPWMVSMVSHSAKDADLDSSCTATLIRPQWVLTAAHCVTDSNNNNAVYPAGNYDVVTGRTDIRNTSEGQRIPVSEIHLHPGAVVNGQIVEDLALLKLSSPSTSARVAISGPAFNNFPLPAGVMATALGWGATVYYDNDDSRNQYTAKLMDVNLPIISNAQCQEQNAVSEQFAGDITNNNKVFCAGYLNGSKSTCFGDSGGPLVVPSGNNKWVQMGVLAVLLGKPLPSKYVNCTEAGSYSGYANLSQYTSWISGLTCSSADVPATPELAVQVSGNQVTLSWNASSLAEGYRLYYAPAPAMSPVYFMDMGQSTSLTAALSSGSSYYVAIQAYHETCNSGFSNMGTVNIP